MIVLGVMAPIDQSRGSGDTLGFRKRAVAKK